MAIAALKMPEATGSQIWAVGGLIDLGDMSFAKKKPAGELTWKVGDWAGVLS